MGGIGSGKSYGKGRKKRGNKCFVEYLPALNVSDLVKKDKAQPNSTFTFDCLRLVVEGARIKLERLDGANFRTPTLEVSALACNYGGFRYFGHCPFCKKRVVCLYIINQAVACRCCLRLAYQSQNATLSRRLLMKHLKVGKKINKDVWNKPKWMRKSTFEELREQYFDLDEKEQIADFYSLRNNQQVDKLFAKYGCAIAAADAWGMQHYGDLWK